MGPRELSHQPSNPGPFVRLELSLAFYTPSSWGSCCLVLFLCPNFCFCFSSLCFYHIKGFWFCIFNRNQKRPFFVYLHRGNFCLAFYLFSANPPASTPKEKPLSTEQSQTIEKAFQFKRFVFISVLD